MFPSVGGIGSDVVQLEITVFDKKSSGIVN
jgi:hypothetical protein